MDKKEYRREYHHRKYEEAKPAYNALMSCYPLTLEDLPSEYLGVILCLESEPKMQKVHILVAQAFIPNPDKIG